MLNEIETTLLICAVAFVFGFAFVFVFGGGFTAMLDNIADGRRKRREKKQEEKFRKWLRENRPDMFK